MSPGAELLVLTVVFLLFACAAAMQLLALYHLVCYLGSQTPSQRWTRSFFGALSFFYTPGLTEKATTHRNAFFRWEVRFLLFAGSMAIIFILLQQIFEHPR